MFLRRPHDLLYQGASDGSMALERRNLLAERVQGAETPAILQNVTNTVPVDFVALPPDIAHIVGQGSGCANNQINQQLTKAIEDLCISCTLSVARPTAHKFKAAALHLYAGPLAVNLPDPFRAQTGRCLKLEQQIGACGRETFSANWSRFRSSRLTSSTHNFTSKRRNCFGP